MEESSCQDNDNDNDIVIYTRLPLLLSIHYILSIYVKPLSCLKSALKCYHPIALYQEFL